MSSKPHSDPVYKEKKIPKTPRKFQLSLNEEQKAAKDVILNNVVTVIKGKAGSGKSLLAAQVALDCLHKHSDGIEKIIIARPAITAGEDIGFLPGSKDDKMAPFSDPVYANMYRLDTKQNIDKLISDGFIEVIPIGFLRGWNFSKVFVVVDEAQNATQNQLELILGRLCIGSKIVICGDSAQIDLKKKADSGFDILYKHMKDIPDFATVTLLTNHRHPIVEPILKVFSDLRA